MRGLKASLYKDLKLFFSGARLLSLALPLLLLPALLLGLGDLSRSAFLQPFPIAVRDEDNTIMSLSLISQIKRVELFSEVVVLDETTTDEDAVNDGAAAVATIPKDFFYDLYVMEECPVTVTLNSEKPLEASLFQAVFRSVMDIIRADHAAAQGVYSFCYGTLTSQLQSTLYEETGMNLVKDALGRQQVFENAVEVSDIAGALQRRLAATLLSVLAFFFSLSSVKTLPEEVELGVLPRFRAIGGSAAVFVVSKFLTALLLTLPSFAAVCFLLQDTNILLLLLLHVMVLFAAFGLQLALTAWTKDSAAVHRLGNLFLLLSLVLGGTVWPRQMLPQFLSAAGSATIPYYAALGLEAAYRDTPMLPLVWPLLLMGTIGILLSKSGFARTGRCRAISGKTESPIPCRLRSSAYRAAGMCSVKTRKMLGGTFGCIILIAVLLSCGAAVSAADTGADSLHIAVCDLDQSVSSKALTDSLQQEGVTVRFVSAQDAHRILLLGECEGLFTIEEGYEQQLTRQKDLPLSYKGASAAVSSQSGREVIAGQVAVQKAYVRAISQAETILQHSLSETETAALLEEIQIRFDTSPALYHIRTSGGIAAKDPFVPDQMAFCALAVLFTLLTAASWCGGPDARAAAVRLRAMPRGVFLSLSSDCLSLTAIGLLSGICTLLPSGIEPCLQRLPALICYCFCTASLALLLTRFSVMEGKIDGLAPILALILCLLGGCFIDLSQVSSFFRSLTILTPPGLALQAASGTAWAYCLLICTGALCLSVCLPSKKHL